MDVEANRLFTFRDWPHKNFLAPKKMAYYGFFYLKAKDCVMCNYCGVQIHQWVRGESICVEHLRWSPSCSWMLQKLLKTEVEEKVQKLLKTEVEEKVVNDEEETSYPLCYGSYSEFIKNKIKK